MWHSNTGSANGECLGTELFVGPNNRKHRKCLQSIVWWHWLISQRWVEMKWSHCSCGSGTHKRSEQHWKQTASLAYKDTCHSAIRSQIPATIFSVIVLPRTYCSNLNKETKRRERGKIIKLMFYNWHAWCATHLKQFS